MKKLILISLLFIFGCSTYDSSPYYAYYQQPRVVFVRPFHYNSYGRINSRPVIIFHKEEPRKSRNFGPTRSTQVIKKIIIKNNRTK